MAKKKTTGLGKGLGALIRPAEEIEQSLSTAPSSVSAAHNSGLRTIEVASIRPNPYQPRTEFDPEALEELADSIREHGLIQPLIVSEEKPGDYILIAGERRWRASQKAGLKLVPVVVKNDVTQLEMLELALIENIQRDDLNALEEGLAYRQLTEEFGMTQAEVAKRVGKGRTTVTNAMRLLDLPRRVQDAVINGQISGGHARALLSLKSEDEQLAVMNDIIRLGLNVRQVEEIVRKRLARQAPKKKQRPQLPPELADIKRQFSSTFGTRVEIEQTKEGGRIVIHYYSDEELNAIYDSIVPPDSL